MLRQTKAILFLSLGAVAFGGVAQDSILIKRVLKANDKDVYKVSTTVKQNITLPNGMGEQEIAIVTTMNSASTVKSVDEKGVADIEVEVSNLDVKMEGPMAGMMGDQSSIPKGYKSSYKMDASGRIFDVKSADKAAGGMMAAMMGSSSGNIQTTFPDKAVKVGDIWDVIVPKSPMMGDKDQILKSVLTGEKEVDGIACWVITTTGPLKMNVDLSKAMEGQPDPSGGAMAGMKMTMEGTIDNVIETFIEKTTGRLISMVSKAKSKNKINMVDMGMALDVSGETITTMSLVKG
jgi:hypothetical protein